MIAAFLATRLGRYVAAAGALVLAVVTFGAWQRRAGAQAARQTQKENDHAAVVEAARADGEFRADGAAERLRSGRY